MLWSQPELLALALFVFGFFLSFVCNTKKEGDAEY
jgi:hypothetical protein